MKKELDKDYWVYLKEIEAETEERIKSIELMDRDIANQFILDLKNDQDNMIRSLKNELNWERNYYNYKNHESVDSDYLDKTFNIKNKEDNQDYNSNEKNNKTVMGFIRALAILGGVFSLSLNLYMPNKKASRSKKRQPLLGFIVSIKYILPKRYREEYSTDIVQIYHELRNEGHSRIYCYFFTGLNVANVLYSALRFKYDEYFTKEKSVSKKS